MSSHRPLEKANAAEKKTKKRTNNKPTKTNFLRRRKLLRKLKRRELR